MVWKLASSLSVLAALVTGPGSEPALAATRSASFTVSAIVAPGCNVSSASIPFGTHTSAVTNARPTVSVSCDFATPYTVSLTPGRVVEADATTPESTVSTPANQSSVRSSEIANSGKPGRTVSAWSDASTTTDYSQLLALYDRFREMHAAAVGPPPDSITITITY